MVQLALLTPDQAGNVGAILRLTACLGVTCHIIEPCGFPFSDRSLKRAGMDYAVRAATRRHGDWTAFDAFARTGGRRRILMTSKAECSLYDYSFGDDDIILMGSESTGAPTQVHESVEARLRIPMRPDFRSLNIAIASGIALAEALRQTAQFPPVTGESNDASTRRSTKPRA